MKNYIGALILLIGGIILIYAGFNPSYDDNTLLGSGLVAVILGFIVHIIINRRDDTSKDLK